MPLTPFRHIHFGIRIFQYPQYQNSLFSTMSFRKFSLQPEKAWDNSVKKVRVQYADSFHATFGKRFPWRTSEQIGGIKVKYLMTGHRKKQYGWN
jgi:hypothetical protein